MHEKTTDEVWEAGMASPEWIELVADVDRGGRSWGRDLLEVLLVAWRGSGEE